MHDTKTARQQYALRYDGMAPMLYRTALWLLGDSQKAQQAVANAFVRGYLLTAKAPPCTAEVFERQMLCALWQSLRPGDALHGAAYLTALGLPADEHKGFAALAARTLPERAQLLLRGVYRCTEEQLRGILQAT